MPTGDGLLVRLTPIGTMSFAAFTQLCAAARTHGNGVIEITARGNIQIRGLNAASASQFTATVAALDIAAQDGVPILGNPLAGLDAEEIFDCGTLAADLHRALAQRSMAARLDAKVSVAIDGGGTVTLDALAADVRLRAYPTRGDAALRVSVGGDGANAADLGVVTASDGVTAVMRLLEALAKRGRDARARDVLAKEGAAVFRHTIADLLIGNAQPCPVAQSGEAVGIHRLRDGSMAYGVGLAFGHADATSLIRLAEAADTAGASGMRAAPGRVLMTIGLTSETSGAFTVAADRLGFIVRADDPRRHVVACAGAPICASAHIASRALAPLIAEHAASQIDGSFTIHISGCAKGCAHPTSAALTVVGSPDGCRLIANGTPRDASFALVSTHELPAAIAKYFREQIREGGHA
jgi:precorrin-3B synthase